jgi:hypothetical protein
MHFSLTLAVFSIMTNRLRKIQNILHSIEFSFLVTCNKKTKLITFFPLNMPCIPMANCRIRYDNHCSSIILHTDIVHFAVRRHVNCIISSNISVRWADRDVTLL